MAEATRKPKRRNGTVLVLDERLDNLIQSVADMRADERDWRDKWGGKMDRLSEQMLTHCHSTLEDKDRELAKAIVAAEARSTQFSLRYFWAAIGVAIAAGITAIGTRLLHLGS